MKTISVLAFVAPTVAAQNTFRYRTFCGPNDGMIVTEDRCKAAAKAGNLRYASAAGPEWHAGCLINNDEVYFSNPEVKGKHDQAVNGGYFCEKQMNIKKQENCAWTDMISNEQMCARAAQENGMKYASLAGPEWKQGCIVEGGEAYYTELRKSGPEGKATNGGQLCINNDLQRKAENEKLEKALEKSQMATMSKLAGFKDSGLDEVNHMISKFQHHFEKHVEKVRDEVKRMNEATSFEEYSLAEKFVNRAMETGLTPTRPSTDEVLEKLDHVVVEHEMKLTRKAEMEAKEAERKQMEAERKQKEYERMEEEMKKEAEMEERKHKEAERKHKEYEEAKKEAERKKKEAEMEERKQKEAEMEERKQKEAERKHKEYEKAKKAAEEAERKKKEAEMEMANKKCDEECVDEWKNQRWTPDDAERAKIMCADNYHVQCKGSCKFCDVKPHIPWHERKQCQPENCKQWSCNDHDREVGSWCACWQEGVDYPLCPATDDDVCDCSGKMSGAKERN